MTKILIYLMVGRIIIFALQTFPKQKLPLVGRLFENGRFFYDLFDCDFCLGFWVYSFLDMFFQINYLSEYFYVPILSYFLTGLLSSLLMHLLRLGWEAKFKTYVIE